MAADEALLDAAEQMDGILMVVAGYRRKAIDAGFSSDHAEQMAVQLHQKILGQPQAGSTT